VGGSNVRVVDAAAGPSPLTKALVLQVRTVEVLASLGLLEEALRRGRPFEGVTLHSAGNDVPVTLSGVDSPRPHALLITQPEIEDILRGALLAEGVRVEWNCRLQGFSEEGDSKVEVDLQHFREGGKLDRLEKSSVEFLLGCDGAHSTVRHSLGVPFEGGRYENEFILTDCLAVVAVNTPGDARSPEGGSNGELYVEYLSDETDAFRRRYGLLAGPAMVLVRPDFHVAFLTDGPDPLAPASDFLRRLGAC